VRLHISTVQTESAKRVCEEIECIVVIAANEIYKESANIYFLRDISFELLYCSWFSSD
jgi:hypothetical protein